MKTLVLGASLNPARASHSCVLLLEDAGLPVEGIGLRAGSIGQQIVKTELDQIPEIHTVSLYLGPQNQSERVQSYILSLHPTRVIFNPGTENPQFIKELRAAGIQIEIGCALVMIKTNQYSIQ
ncbi:MAG: CoA-binding protein [Saprospiraceae bacterium]|nr:CoA-binding protein [Saprospiraceae bacterium]